MKCTDLSCPCVEHVSPATHVPCCPRHVTPLVGTGTPGYGRCLSVTRRLQTAHVGGEQYEQRACTTWGPQSWVWQPRAKFDYRDLPPEVGEPVDVSAMFPEQTLRYRLDVVQRCASCEIDTPHGEVGSTLICLKCGQAVVDR